MVAVGMGFTSSLAILRPWAREGQSPLALAKAGVTEWSRLLQARGAKRVAHAPPKADSPYLLHSGYRKKKIDRTYDKKTGSNKSGMNRNLAHGTLTGEKLFMFVFA